MIWIAIAWLKGRLTALVGLVGRYPMQAALVVLVAALFWQIRTVHHLRAELSAIRTAQVQAGKDQAAVNHAPAATAKAIAEKSNAEAPAYYDRVRRAADANRVSGACIASNTDLPRTDPFAEKHDGPAPAPGMVSRSKADDDLIIAAAARAAQMHEDAEALIAAGVAVKSD